MQELTDGLITAFMEIFAVPEFARPYINIFVEKKEIVLIAHFQQESFTPEDAGSVLHLSPREAKDYLEQSYRRSVLEKTGISAFSYLSSDFYSCLDTFATFKNDKWSSLPNEFRRKLSGWSFHKYVDAKQTNVESIKQGKASAEDPGNDIIVLLDELDEILKDAAEIALLPCDCRAINQACQNKMTSEVCIFMNESAHAVLDRGMGRRIDKKEAREVIGQADRHGLIHTLNGNWKKRGPQNLCNCCIDDCFPFRASKILKSKGIWPQSRFRAVYDSTRCSGCGICVKLCQFNAFLSVSVDEKDKKHPEHPAKIIFSPEKCRGCGVCAHNCKTNSITMIPLL